MSLISSGAVALQKISPLSSVAAVAVLQEISLSTSAAAIAQLQQTEASGSGTSENFTL